ncbi:MAG: hypothetical protein QOE36_3414 [Gaiellaceae bacterium]|jgi:hypothetical protein|nr:hypothetical protein [Gaiellaceae bacterium]
MTRSIQILLIGALACGLAVGCGGSSKKASSAPPAQSTTAAAPTTTMAPTTTESSGSSGNVAANPQVKAAVESCKQAVDAQPTLSASDKSDLKGLCDKAASGDPAAVQKAAKEVCIKIVKGQVPAGAARDQAVAACAQAAQGVPGSTTTTSAGSTTTTAAGSGSTGLNPNSPQVKAAIASCKQSISAQTTLSPGAKKDLMSLCDKAASGDQAAIKQATKEVCVKIVKDSLPPGASRDAALASCNK